MPPDVGAIPARPAFHWPPAVSRASRVLANLYRGFSYGSAVMGEAITSAEAIAAVTAHTAARASVFLDTLERSVFATPSSPYRPLLETAGYDFERTRALVLEKGLEAALSELCRGGVYVSIEEFKGFREARRGAHTFRFSPPDFTGPPDHGRSEPGFRMVSGATRSAGIETPVSPAEQRKTAQHWSVVLAAYGLDTTPLAVWKPQMERVSLSFVMQLSAIRRVPSAWFTQIPGWRFSDAGEAHAFYMGINLAARLRGLVFPPRTYVPFADEARALSWAVGWTRRNGCVILTNASAALRLALAAKQRDIRLDRVTFLTGSEALTPAKHAAIEAAGARAFGMFSFSEFGTAARACATPAVPDDLHVCNDVVAVVQRRRAADQLGTEVDALLFTSLRPEARRFLLNMETGDYGTITARRCGCLLERVGWAYHLQDIRSFEKLNLESWAFLGSKLIDLVEDQLPARFGGSPADYQLLEQEDEDGQTRLTVLVHPRLGDIDEAAVLASVESALEVSPAWADAGVYRRLETLQVRRTAPMLTRAGKVMPLHHLGRSPHRP